MDRIKLARELVKIAKRLVSIPMAVVDANPSQLRSIRDKIQSAFHLGSAKIVDEWYGTVVSERNVKEQRGVLKKGTDHNKYYYVVVFDDMERSEHYVTAASWGRIGKKYISGQHRQSILYKGPDKRDAIAAANKKINAKRKYKKTKFMPWGF